jgi:hypothetical protein
MEEIKKELFEIKRLLLDLLKKEEISLKQYLEIKSIVVLRAKENLRTQNQMKNA